MSFDLKLNSRGMQEMLTSQGVRRVLRQEAQEVAARARSTAPVDSGEYRDSITVVDATTDRAVARVVAADPKGHIVEARTGNLARALGG